MSGTPRCSSYTSLVVLVLLLLLLVDVPCVRVRAVTVPETRTLLGVIKPSMSATSRLHTLVTAYQHNPNISSDVQSQALLSDCEELTATSRDAVRDIIVKLRSKRSHEGREELRTSLSAALTDITTCTDELHDELPRKAPREMKRAVKHIEKQAVKASRLLSKALRLAATSK